MSEIQELRKLIEAIIPSKKFRTRPGSGLWGGNLLG